MFGDSPGLTTSMNLFFVAFFGCIKANTSFIAWKPESILRLICSHDGADICAVRVSLVVLWQFNPEKKIRAISAAHVVIRVISFAFLQWLLIRQWCKTLY